MFQSLSLDGASAGAAPRQRPSGAGRRVGPVASVSGYLAGMRPAQRILWCYLIWYLAVLVRYFEASPALWASSLGISAIIGTALVLSTTRTGRTPLKLERWQIARLYLMPFCVSSFAALIKGHGFVLVFHPRLRDNLIAAAACATFLAATAVLRRRSAAA